MWHFQDSFTLYSTGNVKIIYVSYFFEVRNHVFKKSLFQFFSTWKFFLNTAAGNFYNIFFFKNLPWFKLFNVWVLLSNWQWFRFVPANQSDEGEQYVPGYNGGSKGGRSSGMLHALCFFFVFFFRNFKNSHFKDSSLCIGCSFLRAS